jgi:hypothetical protein
MEESAVRVSIAALGRSGTPPPLAPPYLCSPAPRVELPRGRADELPKTTLIRSVDVLIGSNDLERAARPFGVDLREETSIKYVLLDERHPSRIQFPETGVRIMHIWFPPSPS